jgi:hypothetical protein
MEMLPRRSGTGEGKSQRVTGLGVNSARPLLDTMGNGVRRSHWTQHIGITDVVTVNFALKRSVTKK